uniref:Uncharacterized protein n=1 Tax=Arundo donax TaxID=35708 RepID=A0A0A8ZIX6_ARUDO
MLSISSLMNSTSLPTPHSSDASFWRRPSSELTAPDASSAIAAASCCAAPLPPPRAADMCPVS